MIRKLHRCEDGSALVLDRALMQDIGLEEDAEVELTVSEGSLTLAPVRSVREEERRYHDAFERIASDRRAVLRRLAD